MMIRKKILLISDNISFREIEASLKDENTQIFTASSLEEGFELFIKNYFILVILDVSFSKKDSTSMLEKMCKEKPVPIFVLSGVRDPIQKIESLKIITNQSSEQNQKICDRYERAQSLMCAYMKKNPHCRRCYTLIFGGNLIVDPTSRQVSLNGEPLYLTRKEFDLLFCLKTMLYDKTNYGLFCRAIQNYSRSLPDSLLDWEESRWVQIVKAYMLKNGQPLTTSKQSVYGTTHIFDAQQIRFVRNLLHFLQPEDDRPEQEKDIWHLDKLGIEIKQNPIYKTDTLNFKKIKQPGIREEVKKAMYLHLKYESLDTVKREMSSLRQFSKYLEEQYSKLSSCKDIDRNLMEDYLIHKATNGSSGKSNSDDIIKLRSVLESIGKLYDWPHLEKLLINTDIPQEVQAEFKAYSDNELKRLNAHITKLDEQITRCMVIHQMLGTRISDTLTLQRDCLSLTNGADMIKIRQVKTSVYEKPISAELAALIRKAIQCSLERYGDAVYIFVDEKDKARPLQYTTIKHKVLDMILKEDLRDDDGKRFRFTTHMFRRTYGTKLTELHLDDWTIAKLLGHRGVHSVMHYRKMNHLVLAKETRKAREAQTRLLLANLDGWGEDYEQIRQDE